MTTSVYESLAVAQKEAAVLEAALGLVASNLTMAVAWCVVSSIVVQVLTTTITTWTLK